MVDGHRQHEEGSGGDQEDGRGERGGVGQGYPEQV